MSNINGHGYYHNLPFTTKWSPSSLCFHRSHINGEDLSSCVFDRWRNVSRVLSSVLEVKGCHFYLLKLCCFPTLGIFLLGTLRASRLFKASVNFNLIEIKNEEYKIERKKHKTLAWTALDSWLLGFLSSTSHKKNKFCGRDLTSLRKGRLGGMHTQITATSNKMKPRGEKPYRSVGAAFKAVRKKRALN